MSERVLNIAYLGNGKSANRYHIPFVLTRPEKFRVAAVFAPHIQHEIWDAVPGVSYVEDIDAVLGDPAIDIVEVCTPGATHYSLAKQALEAGKHVVVDKPFSATEAQAAELFDLAESQGVTVQCYQNRRFDSDYLTARQVLASGKLGRVFEVVTSYDYFRPHMMDGRGFDAIENAAFGHATHCLDHLIAWFGAPDRFHAETRQMNGPGTAVDYFDYDLYSDGLGLKVTAHANYAMATQRPSFALYGDRGSYIKMEKDQQERDLKHFYLPAGHEDFGLDSIEQHGVLRYVDEDGAMREERVPSVRSSYAQFYDALYETVAHGEPQLVQAAETCMQLRILEAGMVGMG